MNSTEIQYKIVWSGDDDRLTDEVTNSTKRGWRPLGGVAIHPNGNFYQAMVIDNLTIVFGSKEADEKEPMMQPD